MTLDEAIDHAKHVYETCEDRRCALEHKDLAVWLAELKLYRQCNISCKECKFFNDFHTGAGGCKSLSITVGEGWGCDNAERLDNDDARKSDTGKE